MSRATASGSRLCFRWLPFCAKKRAVFPNSGVFVLPPLIQIGIPESNAVAAFVGVGGPPSRVVVVVVVGRLCCSEQRAFRGSHAIQDPPATRGTVCERHGDEKRSDDDAAADARDPPHGDCVRLRVQTEKRPRFLPSVRRSGGGGRRNRERHHPRRRLDHHVPLPRCRVRPR
jgi:hypothetical protein